MGADAEIRKICSLDLPSFAEKKNQSRVCGSQDVGVCFDFVSLVKSNYYSQSMLKKR